MAVDYIINKVCAVKEELGSNELVQLIKSRTWASQLFQHLLEEGMSEEQALDIRYTVQTRVQNGESKTRQVTVREIFSQSDALKGLSHHCQDCPLNRGEGFGCYDAVNYPISAEAERWLAVRTERAIKAGLPNSILVEAVTGEFFGNLRSDPNGVYLVASEPYEVLVEKKVMRKVKVDTNQVLDMMFAVGVMERTHQMFLILFSGGVRITQEEPDPTQFRQGVQIASVSSEGGANYWIFDLPPEPSDDHSIRQLKTYLRLVFAAFATGSELEVDF